MTDELNPLPGAIGLCDVMEAVDYHAKACVDRAAGEPLDTQRTRNGVRQILEDWNRRAQPEPGEGHQAMWPQMIAALAAIDSALGLPEDGCNSLAQTLAAIRALKAQPEPAAPAGEFCWLVEMFEGDGSGNSAGLYHTGLVDIGGYSRTTRDVYQARRYSTREHAERVATELGTTLTGIWRAVEHGFASAQVAAPSVAPTAPESKWSEPELWAEIHRLRAALKGPAGFDTWQDAATDERIRRVRAERALAAPSVALEPVAWTTLIEIDWAKRNAGRAGSFYAAKAGPNDIPLFTYPPRAPLTVDEAIYALASALGESKGWLRDYSDAVIRDAIDRNEPRALLTDADIARFADEWLGSRLVDSIAPNRLHGFARAVEAAHGISAAAIGAAK